MEMLSVEEIKKVFDNFEVEGFSIYKDSCRLTLEMPCSKLITVDRKYWDSEDFRNIESVYYPLFLQRVIEGINREDGFNIVLSKCDLIVRINNSERVFYLENFDSIDQAKTQAIKYILE